MKDWICKGPTPVGNSLRVIWVGLTTCGTQFSLTQRRAEHRATKKFYHCQNNSAVTLRLDPAAQSQGCFWWITLRQKPEEREGKRTHIHHLSKWRKIPLDMAELLGKTRRTWDRGKDLIIVIAENCYLHDHVYLSNLISRSRNRGHSPSCVSAVRRWLD